MGGPRLIFLTYLVVISAGIVAAIVIGALQR